MKTTRTLLFTTLALLSTFNSQLSTVFAQGTAFTYQGRLNDGANPANGVYDLQFVVYDSTNQPGALIGGPITNSAIAVSNGLFTVTLDFGANTFTGDNRWLDIAVRTNGSGTFLTLSPRQKITPAPYSITAKYLADVVANNTLTSGNASTVGGGAANAASGVESTVGGGGGNNAGGTGATISGGTQNNTFNNAATVAGGNLNVSGGYGATVAGGERNSSGGNWAFIGGGQRNVNSGDYSVIAGGISNQVSGPNGFIGAGASNLSSGGNSVIGGGANNIADNYAAVVGGGVANHAGGDRSVIAGGETNFVGSAWANVGGGWRNAIQVGSQASTIGGGEINAIQGSASGLGGSTISGGWENNIKSNSYFSTISGGYSGLIQSNVPFSVISGGTSNTIQAGAANATIGGGYQNTVQAGALGSTIAGGGGNSIQDNAAQSTIGGGVANIIQTNSAQSTIAGGYGNIVQTNVGGSTIGGGAYNTNSGLLATIAGGQNNTAGGSDSTVGGGGGNIASGYAGTIGGGVANVASGTYSTVPGGFGNIASGYISFAAGNEAVASHQGSFVWADSQFVPFGSAASDTFNIRAQGGVRLDNATSLFFGNQTRQMLNLYNAAYGIGVQSFTEYFRTDVNGTFSWFEGGAHNNGQNNPGGGTELMRLTSSGGLSVFTGTNTFNGNVGIGTGSPIQLLHLNVAAGHREGMEIDSAIAGDAPAIYLNHTGTSGRNFRLASYGDNSSSGSLRIRDETAGAYRLTMDASGNVGIGTITPVSALQVVGTVTATAFNPPSDRNLKEHFTPVNPREVLDKVAAMPISRWNFIGDAATPHIGPMAQDFHAAFGLGTDERHIATVDADGVALAAIQGLNQKVEVRSQKSEDRICRLETENAELKQKNDSLEKRLETLEKSFRNQN